MKMAYNPQKIEPKWQKAWAKGHPKPHGKKGEYYVLDMFPYPSGDGLHVGHVENFTATDIYARFMRFRGYDVLHPIGWDAFGLPAENFAIKTGIHPDRKTKQSIKNFTRQIKSLGLSYDWDREVNTSNSDYYRWTQWMFLFLYKHGLAYKKKAKVNWCPVCQTVLANEQVVDGKCDRSGTVVVQKDLEQWFFKITDFIESTRSTSGKKIPGLLSGLDKIDWPESTKLAQKHWIGRSEGAEVQFPIFNSQYSIEVFTTRLDTIYGCTYVVVAPEHELVKKLESRISNLDEVKKYLAATKKKTDLERTELNKEKTGVCLEGIEAVHPFTGERLPVFVADYVLATYGTGAVMGVPAHDERDGVFAKKYDLPTKRVVEPRYVGTTGEGAIKPNLEFVRRNAVCVVVRNPKDDTYLCIKWKTTPMQGLVTGGLEDDENVIEAARREVREETGYKNLRLTWDTGISNHVKFFHRIKKVNRWARFQYVFFDLENEERGPISQEESLLHDVEWKKKNELQDFFSVFEAQFIFKLLDNPEYIFTEDGILHDSGPYDWLDSEEAREKMVAWLKKEKLGKKVVNYRLRDWLISRQRYWGAPIPIIYCEVCGVREAKTKLSINFYNQNTWQSIVSGEKTVESRALNPEEQHRYFGDVKVGDNVTLVNKKTGEMKVAVVKTSHIFRSVSDLVRNKQVASRVWPGKENATLEDWKDGYRRLAPDYLEKIEKNGLVAWEIELANVEKAYPVPERDLPVKLPTDVDFRPTGESPLVRSKSFHRVSCPKCGAKARRESDTMDTFVCSSWYYLRFADPKNKKMFASKGALKRYLPVDFYMGGAEHTVLHLLYSRFFVKALMKYGSLDFDEPFLKLRHQGMVLAEDGRKMSKSLGNVVNPDDVVREFGADTLRLYEMFMGPLDEMKAWNTKSIIGLKRFLEKVWKLQQRISSEQNSVPNKSLESLLHQTIKKVTEDIEGLKFNTAISSLMIFVNALEQESLIQNAPFRALLILLSPFAPHITEELWQQALDEKQSIFLASWPVWDPKKIVEDQITIAVQINGKVRSSLSIARTASEEEVKKRALADPKVVTHLKGRAIRKVIYVPGKILSLVV